MKQPRFFMLAAVVSLCFASAVARAGDIKFPQDKDPAFSFKVDDKVKSSPDENGNLIVQFEDGCALSLTMIEITPELGKELKTHKDPLADLAQASLKAANAVQKGKMETAGIGGKKGIAFYGTIGAETATVEIKLIFLKVDDKHIASIAVVTASKATPADKDALDKIVQGIKFTKGS